MKRPLQVTLHVRSPSVVELTLGDKVQLDRLVPSGTRHIPERCGDLLEPGTTRLALAQGFYSFGTLSDAHLRIVQGGVEATTHDVKDPWPPPVSGSPSPIGRGDEPPGETPSFTVEA